MSPSGLRRQAAAVALLLVLGLILIPGPRAAAAGGRAKIRNTAGALTQQYPLGTQTLSAGKGRGTTTTGPRSVSSSTTAAASRQPRRHRPARHTQGHAALIAILIASIVLLGLALGTVALRMKGRRPPNAPDDRSDPDVGFAGAPPEMANGSHMGAHMTPRRTPQDTAAREPTFADEDDEVSVHVFDQRDPPPSAAAAPGSGDDGEHDGQPGNVAFELGVMLYERGHHDGAEAAWRRAVQHRHARAATRLGMALERRGDLDGASQAYLDAERWGDAIGSERAAALHGTSHQNGTLRPK